MKKLSLLIIALLALPGVSSAVTASDASGLSQLEGQWRSSNDQPVGSTAASPNLTAEMDARSGAGSWLRAVVVGRTTDDQVYQAVVVLGYEADSNEYWGYVIDGESDASRLPGTWQAPLLRFGSADEPELVFEVSGCDLIYSQGIGSARVSGRFLKSGAGCGSEQIAARDPDPDSEPKPTQVNDATASPVDASSIPATAAPPPPDAGTTVLVAGLGQPIDEARKAVEILIKELESQGVQVVRPTSEAIIFQAESKGAVAFLIEEARRRGAASLLLFYAQFGFRERIDAECFSPNGQLLWKERVKGGLALRERDWMNPLLVERIQQKVVSRIGGIGLPVASASD